MKTGPMTDIPAGRFAVGMVAFVVVLVGFPILFAASGIAPGSFWLVAYIPLLWLLPWLIFYPPARRRTTNAEGSRPG